MKRRSFIKNTTLCAVAVSTSGFVTFDGTRYTGDCETTTDILGPFYRPDSPVRNNFVPKGGTDNLIELSGTIKHKDCTTPYKGAKIELWHCSRNGVYDNETSEYLFRGTTYSDEKGKYSFRTILPVPYDTGAGFIRPAHFHLMITTGMYQPLVTQLYFSGDPNIGKDITASSVTAKRRILDIQNLNNGTKKVLFDVSMSDTLAAEPAAIDRIAGTYIDTTDKNIKTEFFRKNNILWMKNQVFGYNFDYIGNNTFKAPGPLEMTCHFEIMPGGSVKLTQAVTDDNGEKKVSTAIKEK
jgi:protocatechuate 3,4-dioxygenase beta subunit